MPDTLVRVARADRLLRDRGRPVNAFTLADLVGVNHRQVRRYLRFLRELGAPLEYDARRRRLLYARPWDFGKALAAWLAREVGRAPRA